MTKEQLLDNLEPDYVDKFNRQDLSNLFDTFIMNVNSDILVGELSCRGFKGTLELSSESSHTRDNSEFKRVTKTESYTL